MGVAADIARSLCAGPAPAMRDHLARGVVEARSLAFLMLGCLLVFVGQWPRLMRRAEAEGEEFARLVAYDLLGWMVIWPLAFYAVAGLTQVVSRATGGQGSPGTARLALFWSWLAAAPLGLLTGLLAGLTGNGLVTNLAGILWIATFAAFWWLCQREAARAPALHGR